MASNVVSPGLIGRQVAAGTATTIVHTGYGYLHCITINTKGAASNLLTVSDANGTIAIIDTTAAAVTLFYDCTFTGSLTCASATGTGCDYTVSYRNMI